MNKYSLGYELMQRFDLVLSGRFKMLWLGVTAERYRDNRMVTSWENEKIRVDVIITDQTYDRAKLVEQKKLYMQRVLDGLNPVTGKENAAK